MSFFSPKVINDLKKKSLIDPESLDLDQELHYTDHFFLTGCIKCTLISDYSCPEGGIHLPSSWPFWILCILFLLTVTYCLSFIFALSDNISWITSYSHSQFKPQDLDLSLAVDCIRSLLNHSVWRGFSFTAEGKL